MSLDRLLDQDVTVIAQGASTRDTEGRDTTPWTDQATYKGRAEQLKGTENITPPGAQVGDWIIFLESAAVLDGKNRLRVDGVTFELVGPPERHRIPQRGVHHVEALARVVSV